jgi:chromosome segregation ATPase
MGKQLEKSDSKTQSQNQQNHKLNEQKSALEAKLSQLQHEYNDMKVKVQNSNALIQQTCKSNTLFKEEKESLEKVVKDNVCKIKSLKLEHEQLNEKCTNLEGLNESLKNEMELLNRKIGELKRINEITAKDKDETVNVSDFWALEIGKKNDFFIFF